VAGLLLIVGLHKMLVITCAAMEMLAFEEVLNSKQLVKRSWNRQVFAEKKEYSGTGCDVKNGV
jgi:hypothetical protein